MIPPPIIIGTEHGHVSITTKKGDFLCLRKRKSPQSNLFPLMMGERSFSTLIAQPTKLAARKVDEAEFTAFCIESNCTATIFLAEGVPQKVVMN